MRPHVVDVEHQSARKALRDLRLYGLVVRNGIVMISAKLSPIRKRAIGLNCCRARSNFVQNSQIGYLVNVGRELKIRAMAAHIGDLGRIIPGEFMLYAELPLVDFPRADVIRYVS